ncbi:MAG TPA: BlaI/MecI/CopY family transcriptional regulator [Tepidisphaeraceae bacterium]|nr:BlaI/MecI/CopY family transcriptional regulator [Tepidisphaeraceae bacterium]
MVGRSNDVSDGELAVLEVLWERGPAAIRQVTDQLFPGGSTAHYATVQKQLERLEAKAFVARDRTLHVHLFSAAVGRDELIGRRVRAVVDKLCGGSLVPLLSHLAHARELTDAERRALRELVEKRTTPPKRRGK